MEVPWGREALGKLAKSQFPEYILRIPKHQYKKMHTPLCSLAVLLTIAKIWTQPKCPSVDEWIKNLWYIYTMEFYPALKKKELLRFVTAWMYLENIMLSEISQSEKGRQHMMSLICGI